MEKQEMYIPLDKNVFITADIRKKIETEVENYNALRNTETNHKVNACIRKAYCCKDGNRNGMVLLCTAIILSKLGKMNEAAVYIFRCYILCGREFVLEKLGEDAMESLKEYLK